MKFLNDNPNLSLVLPGGCNAHCPFCFWEKDEKAKEGRIQADPVP